MSNIKLEQLGFNRLGMKTYRDGTMIVPLVLSGKSVGVWGERSDDVALYIVTFVGVIEEGYGISPRRCTKLEVWYENGGRLVGLVGYGDLLHRQLMGLRDMVVPSLMPEEA